MAFFVNTPCHTYILLVLMLSSSVILETRRICTSFFSSQLVFLRTFFSSVLRPAGVCIGDIISSHALVLYLLRHVTVTVLFLYIDVIRGISKREFVYTQNEFRMDLRFLPLLSCLHMYASIRLCVEPKK